MKTFITSFALVFVTFLALTSADVNDEPYTCFNGIQDVDSGYFDLYNTGFKSWHLVFRGEAGVTTNVLEAYRTGAGISANVNGGCKHTDLTTKCNNHYRNDAVLDNWANIDQVLLGVIDGGAMVKYVLFDGQGSDYFSWFNEKRVLNSSWPDLTPEISKNVFSIEGRKERHFFINHKYNECPLDLGWFVVPDFDPNMGRNCEWAMSCTFPKIMYSNAPTWLNWNDKENVRTADAFVIFVKYAAM